MPTVNGFALNSTHQVDYGVSVRQKNVIQTKREAPVESVLSIMSEERLPIKVYTVQRQTFIKNTLYHLTPCGNTFCFNASLKKEVENLKQGAFLRNPETLETIGRVTQISTSPSSFTGLYQVLVDVDKAPERNLVIVDIKRVEDALSVSIEAVIRLKGEAFVYVLKEGEITRKNVQIADVSSDGIQLAKGLRPVKKLWLKVFR